MSDITMDKARYVYPHPSTAFTRGEDAYPMPSKGLGRTDISRQLYEGYATDSVPGDLYERYDVKRGLRNADGSGVLVGLTTISNVHGYNKVDGVVTPDKGSLTIRGYRIDDLVNASRAEDRFGYEEIAYLLIAGALPTETELDDFKARIGSMRQLPEGFFASFPHRTYAHSIMNVLQRVTLKLYAYDPIPDDVTPEHEVDIALSLLGRWPRAAAVAHAAYVAGQENEKLMVPPAREDYSMAETVLDVLYPDGGFTREEAMLLDTMFMLHAEHGGGNNSTFTTRVLSSSGTDAYSAYAAAIGSLKGPKHGGANAKVGEMFDDIAAHVSNTADDDELSAYLAKMLRREAFDGTGLIYGLGHAVYTVTDPRAELIKKYAGALAAKKGCSERFELIKSVERLGPGLMRDVRGITKPISTNIDMYTGFIYTMLGIPEDMFTPIFAMARLAGWAAHRMEELYGSARIIRPAYKSIMEDKIYIPLAERQ